MKNLRLIFCLLAVSVLIVACAAKRPVVYPDAKALEVGEAQVRADVEDCIRQAKEAGVGKSKAGEVGKTTAVGAATGAAVGAATGAFWGGAGRGAASGAAGGAVAGLIGGLLRNSDLNADQKQYVEDCLRQKGYSEIRWR
jgi:hypothetical protein